LASKIRLSVAAGDYEIIRALKEGVVQADGLDLVVLTGHGPRERHWRMARIDMHHDLAFDRVTISSRFNH
jgi:4,5-dihydroxyphthalate decarboxylase